MLNQYSIKTLNTLNKYILKSIQLKLSILKLRILTLILLKKM